MVNIRDSAEFATTSHFGMPAKPNDLQLDVVYRNPGQAYACSVVSTSTNHRPILEDLPVVNSQILYLKSGKIYWLGPYEIMRIQ